MTEPYLWPPIPGAPPPPLNLDALPETAAEQRGLVTRAQCLGAGLSRKAVEHRLARGSWVRVQRGVYLTQPGRDDWWTRAYAAHLASGPDAAWSHETAAFTWGLVRDPPKVIDLLVPKDFAVRTPAGARVRRSRWLDDRVDQLRWPWRTTVEETLLDVAADAQVDETFATLGRAFQRELTTSSVLAGRLAARGRHPRRDLLSEVLGDIADGAESAMEVRYVRDVERAHRLPPGQRQHPSALGRPERHDVAYDEQRVLVELDGRLGHDGPGRVQDGRRDRRGATIGWLTVRAFWTDVIRPCALAVEVGAILRTRGWAGQPRRCRRRGCVIRPGT